MAGVGRNGPSRSRRRDEVGVGMWGCWDGILNKLEGGSRSLGRPPGGFFFDSHVIFGLCSLREDEEGEPVEFGPAGSLPSLGWKDDGQSVVRE